MTEEKVNLWVSQNLKNFNPTQIQDIKQRLTSLPEEKWMSIMSLDFKDTTTMLILSIFLGELGVDRFMLGSVGLGILKLLTCGCCGVLWIIDIINIKKMTQDYNYQTFMEVATIL